MTELLNLVDGNATKVSLLPTFTSSQTRISPFDSDLENFVKNATEQELTADPGRQGSATAGVFCSCTSIDSAQAPIASKQATG
jgi:hypothetical protein